MDLQFCPNEIKVTTDNLRHIAASFAFAYGTLTSEELRRTLQYHPTAFATDERPEINQLPIKAILSISSISPTGK